MLLKPKHLVPNPQTAQPPALPPTMHRGEMLLRWMKQMREK